MRKGGGGLSREVKMEAPSPARWKVLIKRHEPQTDTRALFCVFHFVTTNPHRVLSVSSSGVKTYLPITVRGGIEGKFAIGVILGFVLICRIYLQLAFALLIPRVGEEGGVVIQFFKLGYATNSLSRLTITLDAILNGSRGFSNNFNKHTQTCPLDFR